jgi:hypothetical protein
MGGRVPVSPGRGRQRQRTCGETMEEGERCADISGREGKAEPGGMIHV